MKPVNAPKECPRIDGTSGPRKCGLLECPLHLRHPSQRGRGEARRRVRLLLELDDACSVDVAERARAARPLLSRGEAVMTTGEIAIMNGVSRQAVSQSLKSALRKLREQLGADGVRALLSDRRARTRA